MTMVLDIKHFVTNLNLNRVFKAKSSCSSFSTRRFAKLDFDLKSKTTIFQKIKLKIDDNLADF
jgi:hypothetical protein